MLVALDYFFLVLHTGLIFFNLFGWVWRRARPFHLACATLTLGSWIVLGFWYGFGYCPLTEWHWCVREGLGDSELPYSYLKFLFDRLTGLDVNARLVDAAAVASMAVVFPLSIALNIRDFRRRRASRYNPV
ncbi:MAG: hypothetical protein AMXMBFR82_25280 [Candidatus Hydrogenedentota bacterium]